jgi:Flp pilus assembly protein TadD
MLQVPQLRALARLWRSRLAIKEGDLKTGYGELKLATDEWPQDGQLLDELCKFLFQYGPPEETERQLKRFHELQPANPAVPQNLGALHVRQGRYTEAIDWLRQALQIKPDSAEAHLYLGEALHQINRLAEARQSWHDAARLAGDADTKAQALRRLEETGGEPSTQSHSSDAST